MTIIGICTIFLSILIGILIGINTWLPYKSSPLLPEYIVEQPFSNYWTIFIIFGILISLIILMIINRDKKTKQYQLD